MIPFAFGGQDFAILKEGAIFWPSQSALIVADLHLEKASWFAMRGQMLPPYDSAATLDRLGLDPERVQGMAEALRLHVERVQRLAATPEISSGLQDLGSTRLQLSTQWRGQVGLQALTPQDRFSIGGRYTVRGTSSDRILSADHGLVIRNDIELPLNPQASVYLGIDTGWVAGRGTDRLAGRHLAGAVIGARWRVGGLSLDAFGGAPLQQPTPFPPGRWAGGFTLSFTP